MTIIWIVSAAIAPTTWSAITRRKSQVSLPMLPMHSARPLVLPPPVTRTVLAPTTITAPSVWLRLLGCQDGFGRQYRIGSKSECTVCCRNLRCARYDLPENFQCGLQLYDWAIPFLRHVLPYQATQRRRRNNRSA